jgi:hypothetical protein
MRNILQFQSFTISAICLLLDKRHLKLNQSLISIRCYQNASFSFQFSNDSITVQLVLHFNKKTFSPYLIKLYNFLKLHNRLNATIWNKLRIQKTYADPLGPSDDEYPAGHNPALGIDIKRPSLSDAIIRQ